MATNTPHAPAMSAAPVTLDSLLDEVDADGMARYRTAQRQGYADRDAEAMYLGV